MLKQLWHPYTSPAWFSRRIYKALLKRGQAPEFIFEKDFFGYRYQGNFDNHIDIDIFYFGAFEKPMLFFIQDYLRAFKASYPDQPVCFVDIGANIGQHSLFASRLVDQVHSFEPYQKVGQRLQSQIQRNGISNIALHEVGVGNVTEQIPFYAPTGNNLGIGSFSSETSRRGNTSIGNLSIVNGDEYLQAQNIDNIVLMKIDVEGLEKLVLKGLESTLEQYRPAVLVEISYEDELSFKSKKEMQEYLPRDYEMLVFSKRKKDGSKARRKEAAHRSSGKYKLIPFEFAFRFDQDDVLLCPKEKVHLLKIS